MDRRAFQDEVSESARQHHTGPRKVRGPIPNTCLAPSVRLLRDDPSRRTQPREVGVSSRCYQVARSVCLRSSGEGAPSAPASCAVSPDATSLYKMEGKHAAARIVKRTAAIINGGSSGEKKNRPSTVIPGPREARAGMTNWAAGTSFTPCAGNTYNPRIRRALDLRRPSMRVGFRPGY